MKQLRMDDALVKRAACGDLAAFDLLVLKYQHRVMRIIGRYVYDFHEAQDVAQETFVKVFENINSFRGDSAFYTWLYRITINTAKNYLSASRSKGKHKQVLGSSQKDTDVILEVIDIDTPDRILHTKEVESVIRKTIDVLSEELRTALLLREFEGLSYEEIAEVMQCPVGTVRSRIYRAREFIDNKLQPMINFG